MIKEADESSTSEGTNETPDLFPEEVTTEAEIQVSDKGDTIYTDESAEEEDQDYNPKDIDDDDEDTTDITEVVELTTTSTTTVAPITLTEAPKVLNISKPIEDRCRGDDKFRCGTSNIVICETERCDGTVQCDNGEDEVDCPKEDPPTRS